MTKNKKELTKAQAIAKLWDIGNLSYKLKGVQRDIRNNIVDNPSKRSTILASRRTGKSYTLCVVATEVCTRTPNAIVKYVCPKQKMVKTIVRPIMREILQDCPIHLMPEELVAEGVYRFPNGSEIQFAGSDNGNIENIRGGYANLCILDEAGFINDLNYAYYSVLSPTTKTVRGKVVLASTPSKDPNHEFMIDFVKPAQINNELVKFTIYDNPMFTPEIIKETIEEYPMGVEDPQFRREYLCETATDSEIIVIPEFTEAVEKDITRNYDLPAHYDYYVAGDPAAMDLTVILFSYYDYLKRTVVICDELVLGGEGDNVTTKDIADGIKRKEKLLFSCPLTGDIKKPYIRIMDNNNPILINDMISEHGLHFIATAKDSKELQINKVRMMLSQGQILIHPRCVNLIYHIKTAKWLRVINGPNAGQIKGFQRVKATSDNKYKAHHCDALDALIYLVRNIDMNKNPYPDNYFDMKGDSVFFPPGSRGGSNQELKDLLFEILNMGKKKN